MIFLAHKLSINMWIVRINNPGIGDYLLVLDFLGQEFVTEGFVVYNTALDCMQMCAIAGEDLDTKSWFPFYDVSQYSCRALDQPLSLEAVMMLGIKNDCGMIHTKNMENTRERLCDRMGKIVASTSVMIEEE